MSNYSLNSIDLSDYGIVAGQATGGNIAVSGIFDLPQRTGTTSHDWDESDGTEPFVTADEIKFAGRDVVFYGSIFGTNSEINTYLAALYTACNGIIATNGIVGFENPYENLSVYVKNITIERFPGAANITINFREPVVTLTGGTLPATGANKNQIDGIPMVSFGLYSSGSKELHDLAELKDQHFTIYGYESNQVPMAKRKSRTLSFSGFVAGTSLSDFKAKIKALYLVFSSAGTRTIKLNNEVSVVCFATEGFKVSDMLLYTNGMIANFSIKLTIVSVTYL
jgi:hypothetical protein